MFARMVEERTGKRTYNLALTSGPAPASFFLLRRVLERGERPSVVLVDFDAHILQEGPRSGRRAYPWADLLNLRETAELARAARDPDLFVRIVLNQALNAYKNRFEIREDLRMAFRGERHANRSLLPGLIRNWNLNNGSQVSPKRQHTDIPAPPPNQRVVSTWACDEVNRLYLEEFLDLAESQGIAVFWVIPPFPPAHQARLRTNGDEEAFSRFVREIQTRHPPMVVLDGRNAGYESSVFYDDAHLDVDGGAAFSTSLADAVNAYLANGETFPRMCRLPAYRPLREIPLMEDSHASAIFAAGAREHAARRR